MNYDIPHVGIACEYGCYVRCLSWTGRPQNYRPEGSWSSWNISCWIEKAWDCWSSGTSLLWHCEGEMCRCKGHCRCCLQKWNKFAHCGQKYCKDKSVYTLILLWNYLNISHNSLSLSLSDNCFIWWNNHIGRRGQVVCNLCRWQASKYEKSRISLKTCLVTFSSMHVITSILCLSGGIHCCLSCTRGSKCDSFGTHKEEPVSDSLHIQLVCTAYELIIYF